jgi:hypothetical protein
LSLDPEGETVLKLRVKTLRVAAAVAALTVGGLTATAQAATDDARVSGSASVVAGSGVLCRAHATIGVYREFDHHWMYNIEAGHDMRALEVRRNPAQVIYALYGHGEGHDFNGVADIDAFDQPCRWG